MVRTEQDLRLVATVVRRGADRWAAASGYDPKLLTCLCAVVSAALHGVLGGSGVQSQLVAGEYQDSDGGTDGHVWLVVTLAEQEPVLVDLTATQYEDGWPPVTILRLDDASAGRWTPRCYGEVAGECLDPTSLVEATMLLDQMLMGPELADALDSLRCPPRSPQASATPSQGRVTAGSHHGARD